MRPLVVISAGAAIAAGVWWLTRPRQLPVPAAINNPVNQSTNQFLGELDYLNFDFESLLFPGGQAVKPEQTYPLQGDNAMQPRGIANNNPLNIEYGDNWQGLTGSDGRFATFESVFYGIRAAGRILKNYRDKYGLKTVTGIVNRWAPPSDNNPTQKYIDFVANNAGVNADAPLSMADYPRVVAAMIHFENGFNPYDQNEIITAVNAGFA